MIFAPSPSVNAHDRAWLIETIESFLFQYEKEYFAMKDAERAAEDPLVRLERENKKLQVKTWPFL